MQQLVHVDTCVLCAYKSTHMQVDTHVYSCVYLRFIRNLMLLRTVLLYTINVTGFAKTVLKGTFCISRNINLKY